MDPIPPWMQRIWDIWDTRVMILWSLVLQIILILVGGRRKYIKAIWIDIVIWPAYLMADWVASVSLSKLSGATGVENSSKNNNTPDSSLMALWAALFLVHLGGPDTVTAFSVEDVQLWLRHALGLVIHVFLVVYIFLRCWTSSNWLSYINFLMFIAGIIKYAERTWALFSANSMFPQPFLPLSRANEQRVVIVQEIGHVQKVNLLTASYIWLQNMSPTVFANLQNDRAKLFVPIDMYGLNKRETMFKFIEIVLGFMYDAIYTKATRIYSITGSILRSISFICEVAMLVGFSILPKHDYSNVDICITYLLLVGAVIVEVCAITSMMFSELTIVWMARYYKKKLVRRILQILVPVTLCNLRWSSSVQQLNLVNLLLFEQKPRMLNKIIKLFGLSKRFKEYMCRSNVNMPEELKVLTIEGIRRMLNMLDNVTPFTQRGELTLNFHKNPEDPDHFVFAESVRRNFDESLMIWHLVTDYCYYKENRPRDRRIESLSTNSKLMSDYMMYLVVSHPYMLNIAPGKVELLLEKGQQIFQGDLTQDEAMLSKLLLRLLDEEHFDGLSQEKKDLLRRIVDLGTKQSIESLLGRVYNLNSKRWQHSKKMHFGQDDPLVASEGRKDIFGIKDMKLCLGGHLLDSLMDDERRWEIISQVWVEMLFHGAAHCQVSHHLQQLRRGGELLTHVWLLLTIHGLTDANRILGNDLRLFAKNAVELP